MLDVSVPETGMHLVAWLLEGMSAEQAWQLKEGLRDWYATATKETAADQLDCWIDQVNKSTCDPPKKALSAFRRWREEILAFFRLNGNLYMRRA